VAAEVTKRVQGKPEQKRLEVILGDVIKQEPLPDFDVSQVICIKGVNLIITGLHLEYAISNLKSSCL